MPYEPLPGHLARKDRLSFGLVNMLAQRLASLRSYYLREHDVLGAHDALEIPRVVFTAVWDSLDGEWDFTVPSGFSITAPVDHPDDFTLPDVRQFSRSGPLIVRARSLAESWPDYPSWVTYKQLSERVFLPIGWRWNSVTQAPEREELEDALPMVVAVHIPRARVPGGTPAMATPMTARQSLSSAETGWNRFVQRLDDLYRLLLLEHSAAGEHDVYEIPKGFAKFSWDGANYAIDSGRTRYVEISPGVWGDVSEMTPHRIGTGHVRVRHPWTGSNIRPFVTAFSGSPPGIVDPVPFGTIVQGGVPLSSITEATDWPTSYGVMDVYLWQYNPPPTNTWTLSDMGFALSVHA